MTSLAKTLLDFSELWSQIEEAGGEISDEMMPVLSQVEMTVAKKVDDYVNFYEVVKGQIERTKKTIDNFKKTQQTLENLEARLKSNVKHIMESHELLSINGNERTIKLISSGGVAATHKPDDMFYTEKCVNEKYFDEIPNSLIERKVIYVIRDEEQFKEAVKANKIKSCFVLPRGKYVKFT